MQAKNVIFSREIVLKRRERREAERRGYNAEASARHFYLMRTELVRNEGLNSTEHFLLVSMRIKET